MRRKFVCDKVVSIKAVCDIVVCDKVVSDKFVCDIMLYVTKLCVTNWVCQIYV